MIATTEGQPVMNRSTDHSPVRGPLRDSATTLAKLVADRGMTLTVEAAETFLAEQPYTGAKHHGHQPHNVDRPTLDELADRLVSTFADEEPGGDLFTLPRTARISVNSFGRLIAGLAETIQFLLNHPMINESDRQARIRETAQLLSVAGLLQADHTDGRIDAPPAMFARIARTLTTTADLTDNDALSTALRRDAMRARAAQSS